MRGTHQAYGRTRQRATRRRCSSSKMLFAGFASMSYFACLTSADTQDLNKQPLGYSSQIDNHQIASQLLWPVCHNAPKLSSSVIFMRPDKLQFLIFVKMQLETAAEINRILLNAEKSKKSDRNKSRSRSASRSKHVASRNVGKKYPSVRRKIPGPEPAEHYKLNLAEIPFLTGKVTGFLFLKPNKKEKVGKSPKENIPHLAMPQAHILKRQNHLYITIKVESEILACRNYEFF